MTGACASAASGRSSSQGQAITARMLRVAVQAKRPLFQSAPAAMKSSAVAASGFSEKRATLFAVSSRGGPGTM